jgi:prepilin-type N-terminal cleavage/methylation domain-containing protein
VNRLRRLIRDASDERGMTLIEVVVAVVILALLSTISLNLYITSMTASKTHQNRELAIAVANESMEIVSGWSATTPIADTNVSILYEGRARADVESRWAAAPADAGLEHTYPAWDPNAPTGSVPKLPFTRDRTFSDTDFVAETFIGTCYQPISGGDCRRLPGVSAAPAAAPSGYTAMTRTTVVVSWDAANCDSGSCQYKATTLLNLNSDLDWFTND